MLFFAGAHKNGSHFQYYVVEEALRQQSIPYRAIGSEIFHQRELGQAWEVLAANRDTDEYVLCKGHWYRKREQALLFAMTDISIFLIWRNLRDVLISSYYYKINKFGAAYRDLSEFYFADGGRKLLIE